MTKHAAEVTEICVENLANAFDQMNSYLAVGVTAAISALVIELSRKTAGSDGHAETPFGKVRRDVGQLIFIGVFFVTGLMASYAGETAMTISKDLDATILGATCTRASVATGPVGVTILAIGLPLGCALYPVFKAIGRLSNDKDARKGLFVMAGLVLAPYLLLGRSLFTVCP